MKEPPRKKSSAGLIIGLVVGGVFLLMALVGTGATLFLYFVLNRAIPEADWQVFSPPGSGCTLLLPGTPIAKPHKINGIAIDKYVVERRRERIVFGFAFLTLGANPLKANALEAIFGAGRDELLRRLNGTVMSEQAISLGNIPGREIEVRASDASQYVCRIYVARVGGVNRIYEISVGGYSASREKADVVRYFDSLRMDGSAAPPSVVGGVVAQGPQPPVFNPPFVKPPRRNPVPPGKSRPRPTRRPNPSNLPGQRAVWGETSGTQALSLSFSPDSATLAVGHWDKKLRLWDAAGGKDRQVIPLDGSVMAAAFSSDGKRLVCGTDNGDLTTVIVPLWDVSDINAPKKLQPIQLRHTRDKARAKALCFTPDGKGLAIGLVPDSHSGSQVVLWDLENNKERAAYRDCKEDVKKLAFTTDGAVVILMPSSVLIWDPASGQIRREFKGHNPAEHFVTTTLASDGQLLATMCKDKKVRIWRLSDGQCTQTWPVELDLIRLEGCAFEYTPDNKYLAMRGQGAKFHVWNAHTGKELEIAQSDPSFENIGVMTFSPDSRLLAWHGNQGSRIMEVAVLMAGN